MQSKICYWWKLNILYIVDNPIVIQIPVAIVRPYVHHQDDDDESDESDDDDDNNDDSADADVSMSKQRR